MKKRLMALLLAIALIATSNGFAELGAMVAHAAEANADGVETPACKGKAESAHEKIKVSFKWADDFTCKADITCEVCGDTWKDRKCDVTAKVTKEPTCVAEGTKEHTAVIKFAEDTYQDVKKETLATATAHTYKVTKAAKAATCTEDGWTEAKECTVKGCTEKVVSKAIIAEGHKEKVTKEAQAPTCVKAGWTEEKTCTVCEKVTVPSEEVPIPTKAEELSKAHKYATPIFSWSGSGDKTKCTVSFKCELCGTLKEEKTPCTVTSKVTTAPTCTKDGVETFTAVCTCGENHTDSKEVVVKALGHSDAAPVVFKWNTADHTCVAEVSCTRCDAKVAREAKVTVDASKAATCTTDGVIVYKAAYSIGDNSYSDEYKENDKAHHTDVQITKEAKAATCTEAGNTEETKCKACNTTLTTANTIKALGHDEKVTKEEKAATCTVDGNTVEKTCDRCKKVTVASKVVEAPGHKKIVTKEAKAATCTEAGNTVEEKCSVCNTTLTASRTLAAKGHKEVDVKAAVAATCTTDGATAETKCETCGIKMASSEVIKATGHTPTVTKEAVAATCTTAGSTEEKTCSACKEVTSPSTVVAALGHKEVITKAAVAATCTEAGNTEEKTCSVCNTVTVASTVVEALGHKEAITKAAVAATCTEAGNTEEKTCSVCNKVTVASTVIPAIGHNTVVVDGKPATCTEDGYTASVKCTTCGVVVEPAEVIKAGHVYKLTDVKWSDDFKKCSATFICEKGDVSGGTQQCVQILHESNVAPTCTTDGGDYYTARFVYDGVELYTERTLDETTLQPKLGHEYIDDKCTRCGIDKPYAEITFTKESNAISYTGKAISVASSLYEVKAGTGKVTFEYFVDETCTTPTFSGNEAKEGKAPSAAGVYYVRALIEADEEYKANESDNILKLTVRPRKVGTFEVSNSTSTIKLTWSKRDEADGYIIYRKTGNDDYKAIKTITDKTKLSYTDGNITQGKQYRYNIVAYKDAKNGDRVQSLKRDKGINIVRAKVISVTNKNGSVTVKWTKLSGVAGYKVYRKASGYKSYELITTIKSASTNTYTDKTSKTLRNGKASYYYVVPYFKNSSNVIVKTNTKTNYYVTRPTSVEITTPKTKALKVAWKKNSSATGYQVRYSKNSDMSDATTVTTTSLSKTISSLTKSKTYYVQVRAYKTYNDVKYYSAWTVKKSKKTK